MSAAANWVKQAVSGTPGTGTITLGSASTGFLAIGDVFPHDFVLEYFIEDGNNREHGVGTYTHSGTTLARTRVIETLSSGTYDATAPAAISLTSAALVYIAVGGAVLRCPPRFPDHIETDYNYFANAGDLQNTSAGATTANTCFYQPSFIPNVENIEALFTIVNSVNTATKSRMGLYSMGSDGKPKDLIVSSGDITPAVDISAHTFTAQAIQPGWYYCACVYDQASSLREWPSTGVPSWAFNMSSVSDAAQVNLRGYTEALGAWSTLPASAGDVATVTESSGTRIVMGFRRV